MIPLRPARQNTPPSIQGSLSTLDSSPARVRDRPPRGRAAPVLVRKAGPLTSRTRPVSSRFLRGFSCLEKGFGEFALPAPRTKHHLPRPYCTQIGRVSLERSAQQPVDLLVSASLFIFPHQDRGRWSAMSSATSGQRPFRPLQETLIGSLSILTLSPPARPSTRPHPRHLDSAT